MRTPSRSAIRTAALSLGLALVIPTATVFGQSQDTATVTQEPQDTAASAAKPVPKHHSKKKGAIIGGVAGAVVGGPTGAVVGAGAGAGVQHARNEKAKKEAKDS
jgi:outer membrane lipoprotein SlyB